MAGVCVFGQFGGYRFGGSRFNLVTAGMVVLAGDSGSGGNMVSGSRSRWGEFIRESRAEFG